MDKIRYNRDCGEEGKTAVWGTEMECYEEWKESCFVLRHGKKGLTLTQIWKEDTISLCFSVLIGAEHTGMAVPPRSR